MHIQFTQDWQSFKTGDISDDLHPDIARGIISAGQAKESDPMSFVRSSLGSELKKMREEQATANEALRTALLSGRATNTAGPPNGTGTGNGTTPDIGDGVMRAINDANIQTIRGTSSAVDRELENIKKKGCGFSRALKLIEVAGHPERYAGSPNAVHHASQVLQAMSYGAREYAFNDNTGEFTETERNILPGGGVETITRTGTDSLSGGSTYGFALKPEFLGNLFEVSQEQQVFVNATQSIPVSQGNEVKWPAWDQYRAPVTNSQGVIQSAVFAGISLYYEGETAARVASDAQLNMINFKVVDLTFFTALSRDFIRDNHLAFDAALLRMFGRAIGWMEDYMSIQGAGLGKPQGYFNGPSTLVVNRAASSKIRPVDLTGMIASISPMVWDDLRWITNISTFGQLSILNDGTNYVFQPNALISQAMKLSAMDKSVGGRGAELMHRPMGDLLGFPLYFSEKVPTLGNTGDLSLVAPSQYGVARREGLEMGISEHFYFSTDLTAYRGKVRHDMKPLWRAPYQQADGSATQVAPFVLLH